MSLLQEIHSDNCRLAGTNQQKEVFCQLCNVDLSDILYTEFIGKLYKYWLFCTGKGIAFSRSTGNNIKVSVMGETIYYGPGFITAINTAYSYAHFIC